MVNPPAATGSIVILAPAVIVTSSSSVPSLNLKIALAPESTPSKVYVLPASLVAVIVVPVICNPVPTVR